MRLKNELYAQNQGYTLAENIDKAWSIYGDITNQSEKDRRIAQSFLIYAFDLKSVNNINGQLLALMEERNKYKAKNPEYIPGLSPKNLNLNPDELILERTQNYKKDSNPKINRLLNAIEILDVNPEDKVNDLNAYNPTHYFNNKERAERRVHIYKGKFYQQGELFDTEQYESHQKKGYAAFTLNANGELSVFKHAGMADHIAHSSMNSGSPVVCAGELIITNGELVAINTYSGHYQTALFSVFRALEHFNDKGINVADTTVYTITNPIVFGLQIPSPQTYIMTTHGYSDRWFKMSGNAFIATMREKLNQSLQSIQDDTREYQGTSFKNIVYAIKDSLTGSTLTSERKAIAVKIELAATQLVGQLSNDNIDNSEKLQHLIKTLETLQQDNCTLSQSNGKSADNGRLNEQIESFLKQAHAIHEVKLKLPEETLELMKLVY